MAYFSGSAVSPADLKSIIEAFAVANGWTNTGGVIHRDSCYIQLTAVDTSRLTIIGADDASMAVNLSPQKSKLWIPNSGGNWPVTFRLFASGSPNQIFCVVQYAVTKFQWLGFGTITKYGAWDGGAWFGASHGDYEYSSSPIFSLTGTGPSVTPSSGTPSGALFWTEINSNYWDGSYRAVRSAFIRAGIDGYIWPGAGTTDTQSNNNERYPSFCRYANPLHIRQPHTLNNNAPLVPYWLFMPRASGYYSCIGHVEHVRALRVDNYNAADLITIGSEQWMVFPWHEKDLVNRDGGTTSPVLRSTGTYGYALRYEP